MSDSQFSALADGGLHTAHRFRPARNQAKPGLAPNESKPLLGACPPREHAIRNQSSGLRRLLRLLLLGLREQLFGQLALSGGVELLDLVLDRTPVVGLVPVVE